MLNRYTIWIVSCCLMSSTSHSFFNKTGNFLELHSGSMMGMTHVSYGWEVSDRHNWSLGMGYVPELSYHDEMTIFSARYRYQRGSLYEFNLFDQHIRIRPGSFGMTFISGRDNDIYRELPDKYPDGYYYSTARRLILNYQWNFLIVQEIYFSIVRWIFRIKIIAAFF